MKVKEAIQGLEPQSLWDYFYQINQIPRCSKHEEKVRNYVIEFAKSKGLDYKLDDVQNVVIKKPASPGCENKPGTVLQSHLDMVCEKNKDTQHDFSQDPIKMVRENGWLKADGTTLGSDNGIGVAAALAVLDSDNIKHGPIECLFTMDEETGLTGATELGNDMLEGRILINMDTEEDGAFYIGCAGGKDTRLVLNVEMDPVPSGYIAARVRVGGLQGGHSGINIHEGRGNAIKLLTRFLWKQAPLLNLRIASMDGGSMHNAIPRECDAVAYLPAEKMGELKKAAEAYTRFYKNEYNLVDRGVSVMVAEDGFEKPGSVFTMDLQNRLLNLIYSMPHGVLAMSNAVPGLVETSTNMAVIHTEGDQIKFVTSQRSSVQSELDDMADMVYAVGLQGGAEIHSEGGYPAWEPNPDSAAVKIGIEVYKSLYDEEPEVKAVHAGLECGIIGDKFPGMDMISFGPTILGAHSPDERVEIKTVEKFWELLKALLEKFAN
jgi:dipeptidase D